jgi:hypothetical protein
MKRAWKTGSYDMLDVFGRPWAPLSRPCGRPRTAVASLWFLGRPEVLDGVPATVAALDTAGTDAAVSRSILPKLLTMVIEVIDDHWPRSWFQLELLWNIFIAFLKLIERIRNFAELSQQQMELNAVFSVNKR